MTIESPPLYIQADTYPARLDRFPLAKMFDEGVMKPTHCKVGQRGAGANFSVDIAVGEFVIQGDDQTNQGSYLGRITAIENVAITAAPGSNSRYDLVTLRVNDPNAGGNAGSNVTAVVVAGTASASPTVPALPASSIALAVIGPIATSTPSITTALIKDVWSGGLPASAPAQVRYLAGRIAPAGEMTLVAGAPAPWSGWLYCDGSAVSRSTYSELFAAIATTYGVGDGSTTFNLPDMRGKLPVGAGGSFSTGATGGEVTHTLTTAEVPASPLTLSGPTVTQSAELTGGGIGGAVGGSTHFDVSATVDTTNSGTVAGGGGAHNNMPPYVAVAGYLIRT